MGKQVQIEGGATAQLDALLGVIRQLLVDTSRNEIRVMDGVTPGGARIPNTTTVAQMIAAALSNSDIVVKFFDNIAALKASPIGDSILAVVKDQNNNTMYRWDPTVPALIASDTYAVTSNIAGAWIVIDGVGHAPRAQRIYSLSSINNINDLPNAGIYLGAGPVDFSGNGPASGNSSFILINSGSGNGGYAIQAALCTGITNYGGTGEPTLAVRTTTNGIFTNNWTYLFGQSANGNGFTGKLVFAKNMTAGTINPGGTIAGASLQWADADNTGSGSPLPGTWGCAGYAPTLKATLFVRTA